MNFYTCLGLLLLLWNIQVQTVAAIDFNHDIRPILSDKCYFCHGPDAERRAADLRLDDESEAKKKAIVAGKPEDSEIISRIFHSDPEMVMPPPESNLKLSTDEKAILSQWIKEGAAYDRHWALTPLNMSLAIPESLDSKEELNPIDYFVRDRLKKEGISHAARADRETLIRRLSFDLTGLPPSIKDIEKFKQDQRHNAYELLVDGMLSTKAYGEHMAVAWLDAARYADTYGYQNDRYRAMWPWRDWVISAFNNNLPYDDFLKWQIAGDLLPNPTREQILATAYNRNHRQTNEGGSVEEEFRAEYIADRINTFGASMLGITLECCRCHDHKYDPISQKNYYELAAFFNSIDESGLYSHFNQSVPTPTLLLSADTEQQEIRKLDEEIALKELAISKFESDHSSDAGKWLSEKGAVGSSSSHQELLKNICNKSLESALIGDFSLDSSTSGKVENRKDAKQNGKLFENPQAIEGKVGRGLQLSGENNLTTTIGGDFTRHQPFTISLWINPPKKFSRAVIYHRSRAWTDSGSRGYELILEDGKLSAAFVHFWPGNAIRVNSLDDVPINQWSHVTVTYDGSSRASGIGIFINGEHIPTQNVRDSLTKQIDGSDGFAGGESKELTFGQRFRDVGFKDGKIDEVQIFSRCLTEVEVKHNYVARSGGSTEIDFQTLPSEKLNRFYFATQDEEYQKMELELRELREKQSQLVDAIPEIMVMRELPSPRQTFVLVRGAYDSPGDKVDRDTPASILPMRKEWPRNRLGLADWLIDKENPLTARVAVNRFWQSFFGRGLVATTEDFGLQGSMPSHPALLDWLSVDFIKSGWDVKRLVKQIVMSATYQQSSDASEIEYARDPENEFLARGPSYRLSAEMIRDSALTASGLLVEKLGGPPVKPYQPPGMWEEKSGEKYERDIDEGSRRRSVYTYWKRTSPPPSMMTFDASNREVCVVRRQVTLTPLQVLVLLNDPQFVEASIALSASAMKTNESLDSQLIFIFQRLTSRTPNKQEHEVLQKMYYEQFEEFELKPESVQQLLEVGDYRADSKLDSRKLAALTVIAEGLMSYDETVMKR